MKAPARDLYSEIKIQMLAAKADQVEWDIEHSRQVVRSAQSDALSSQAAARDRTISTRICESSFSINFRNAGTGSYPSS